jgi:hypothetical protein
MNPSKQKRKKEEKETMKKSRHKFRAALPGDGTARAEHTPQQQQQTNNAHDCGGRTLLVVLCLSRSEETTCVPVFHNPR